MSAIISFTSQPKPPADITSFKIQRSERPASGTIANAGDVNTTTNVITITFDAPTPSDGSLAGDLFIADGISYEIDTNDSTTITIISGIDLTPITALSFPLSVVVIDDMAEFGNFEDLATDTPTETTWDVDYIHQYTDSTGTDFDWYKTIPVNTAGVEGVASEAFRPENVTPTSYSIPARTIPKDRLWGLIGGTMEFEVESIVANERIDPIGNTVVCYVYKSPLLSGTGFQEITHFSMTRMDKGRDKGSWTIPSNLDAGDEYVAVYLANFYGLYTGASNADIEFASEYFELRHVPDTISGKMGRYVTVTQLRRSLQHIDSYISDELAADVEARNEFIYDHIKDAADFL